jgi:hypothetical protein
MHLYTGISIVPRPKKGTRGLPLHELGTLAAHFRSSAPFLEQSAPACPAAIRMVWYHAPALLLLLLLLAASSTASAVSPQRNITGTISPFIVPADATAPRVITVHGEGFGTRAAQPSDLICHVKDPDWAGPANYSKIKVPAIVLNDTHVQCTLVGKYVPGPFGVCIESASHSDPAKHVWWSSGSGAGEFRVLVEPTPDRRPYLSSEIGAAELLVAIDRDAISRFPSTAASKTVKVCATLERDPHNPYLPPSAVLPAALEGLELLPCKELALATLEGGDGALRWSSDDAFPTNGESVRTNGTVIVALPLDKTALSKLPSVVPAASLLITTSVGSETLVPKRRAFVVAPSEQLVTGQGYSVVDHKRRMVRFEGEPWLGVGYYVSGSMVNKSAPGYPHTITPTVPRMLDTMHDFKRQGLSQIMPYDAIVLPPSVRSEFVNGMDHVRKQLFTPLVRY